jgi:hypothetical protein
MHGAKVKYLVVFTHVAAGSCPIRDFFFPSGKESRLTNYENNQLYALYRLIYYSRSALHVSGDVFAHHQEHLTVVTVSGNVHSSC